ncbi:unnamed protein product [Parnassius mnemosyne]|uniref:Uncharacterized protein n=1 Tax=Parnassius mnemosyne TaxID=213953 RepID=A0AAV1K8L5_9NEOP
MDPMRQMDQSLFMTLESANQTILREIKLFTNKSDTFYQYFFMRSIENYYNAGDNTRMYTSMNNVRGGANRKRHGSTSTLNTLDTHAPPPTNPKDKKRLTLYKTAALKNQEIEKLHAANISEYHNSQEEEIRNSESVIRRTESDNILGVPSKSLIILNHDYCFSEGRHSGSFYLKMGAAGFAVGHLVHSILLITLQINYYLDENIDNQDCVEIFQLIFDIINPLYSFVQLYFIFQYSNVIILRAQGLAQFGFMHLIGSSLCFWTSTITRETKLALTLYANSKYKNSTHGDESVHNFGSEYKSEDQLKDISDFYNKRCEGSSAIFSVFQNLSPYLYPFSVEFNILIVAVLYIIWSNIGNCSKVSDNRETNYALEEKHSVCKIRSPNEDTSSMVIHVDCQGSNRGLFMGLILIVIVIGMLVIGFVFSSVGEKFAKVAYHLNDLTKLFMHVMMLVAAVIAYKQSLKLDINEHPVSLLDDVLLFICLPAFFMDTVFSMAATISLLNIVKTIDFAVMIIQVIIQTPLLVDGLRRCSNSRKLRRTKPGRDLFMFLIIANVGMWLLYTFSYKSPDSQDERYEYYGKVLWTKLGHVSLPFVMFYRFHSSVCFADIWYSAYKPSSEH